jgi:hypothetical protein
MKIDFLKKELSTGLIKWSKWIYINSKPDVKKILYLKAQELKYYVHHQSLFIQKHWKKPDANCCLLFPLSCLTRI